ncbi:hypothetical protein AB0M97_26615 [Streptomyces sp. NPDC051207]|uniref:hypothetical protein n=1 Tax=Streptomyces sp. NPDC051207 TaxID=3154641 RepID=UPI0034279864
MALWVLGGLVVLVVVTGVLAGRDDGTYAGRPVVVRGGGRGGRWSGADRLRGAAVVAGLVAGGSYLLGLAAVGLAVLDAADGGTDSAPYRPCRTEGWLERSARGIEIVDYSVRYLPLAFRCETSDGGRYDSGEVPGWVNPVAVGGALLAAGCRGAAVFAASGPGAGES